MPSIFHALAKDDETNNDQRHGEVDDAEADLGFEAPFVGADVLLGVGIVQPVADNLSEKNGDKGCKIEEASLSRSETIEVGHKDGKGCVNADSPSKGLTG
jgi:hypothetical protein